MMSHIPTLISRIIPLSLFLFMIHSVAIAKPKLHCSRGICEKEETKMQCEKLKEKPSDILLITIQSCPYCYRVVKYLEENDLQIDVVPKEKFTAKRAFSKKMGISPQDFLLQQGGLGQVPCLFIKRTPSSEWEHLYESTDIICWLKENRRLISNTNN